MTETFACGHPRSPENSTHGYLHRNGKRYAGCALCRRVRSIVIQVDEQLARWKSGTLTRGETILRRIG